MVICLHRNALTQNAGLGGGNKKIPSWANQKAAFEEVRPALQSRSLARTRAPASASLSDCQNILNKQGITPTSQAHSLALLAHPSSNHVWTRQGQDGEEGCEPQHQGRPAVPRGPHRPLPQEGQGVFRVQLCACFMCVSRLEM